MLDIISPTTLKILRGCRLSRGIRELVKETGVSPKALIEHVGFLARQGMVEVAERRMGRGRPRREVSITALGRAFLEDVWRWRIRCLESELRGTDHVYGATWSLAKHGVKLRGIWGGVELVVSDPVEVESELVEDVVVWGDADMFRHSNRLQISGEEIPVLAVEDLLIYILKHRVGEDEKLRVLLAVPTVVAKNSESIDYDYLLEKSRMYGVVQEVGFMLSLANRFSPSEKVEALIPAFGREPLYPHDFANFLLPEPETDEFTKIDLAYSNSGDPIDSVASRWRLRTNLALEDFESFYATYTPPDLLLKGHLLSLSDPLEGETIRAFLDKLRVDEVYVLGGSSLVLWGLKESTEDIDLAVEDEEHFSALSASLKALGFKEYSKGVSLRRWADGFGVDVFVGDLVEFALSDSIRRRCKTERCGKTIAHVVHPQDVLMVKSCIALTRRWRKDVEDMRSVVKSGSVDWSSFVEEMRTQKGLISHSPHWLFRVRHTLSMVGAPPEVVERLKEYAQQEDRRDFR